VDLADNRWNRNSDITGVAEMIVLAIGILLMIIGLLWKKKELVELAFIVAIAGLALLAEPSPA